MDYNKANKEAWEEAFAVHQAGYKEDPVLRLKRGELFLRAETEAVLVELDLAGKSVAQFCCNNGIELLSLLKMGAAHGTGFDITEGFTAEGRRLASEAGLDADFVAIDIYDIDDAYAEQFDLVLVTCGVLSWFPDLDRFFAKVALVLKDGGTLVINEMHPYTNMLATTGEEGYEASRPDHVTYSYFKEGVAWVDTDGVDYIGGTKYASKPLYSYSHGFGKIVNAMSGNGLTIGTLTEFDHDVCREWSHLEGKGMPLSYLLVAAKRGRQDLIG